MRERLAERARTSPLDPGLRSASCCLAKPWAAAVASLLHVERRGGKAYAPGAAPQLGDHAAEAAAVMEQLAVEDCSCGSRTSDLAGFLEAQGTLKRVGDRLAVPERLYERGPRDLAGPLADHPGRLPGRARVSRRTAQLLLERFDADGLTRRVGDERVLRRSRAGAEGGVGNVQWGSPRSIAGRGPVHLRVLAVMARGALGQPAQENAHFPRRLVDDRDAVVPSGRDVELGRPGVGDRRAHELVDPRLDGEQELTRRDGDVEGRVEPREGDLRGEDAELEQDLVRLAPGAGRGQCDEAPEIPVPGMTR